MTRLEMLDQSSIPGLKVLVEAVAEALPDHGSNNDPQYLSRSALDICITGDWSSDKHLASVIEFARRYWDGQESDEEREKMRIKGLNRMQAILDEGAQFSPEWCKWALATWSLDVTTPSNGYEADYLLDFGLKAGASLDTIRTALEARIPGLSEIIRTGNASKRG